MFDVSMTEIIARIPALLIGFAFHEYAHAWMADRLGDPTPRSQGRLTLNPIAHLDLFGAIMALIFRFGWAKPVMTNPHYFRMNPIKGRMYVALMGPLANLLMAFLSLLVGSIIGEFTNGTSWYPVVTLVFREIVLLNIALGIFNLLPVPPLDGFAVLAGLLPGKWAVKLYQLEQYSMLILALVLFSGVFNKILGPAMSIIYLFDASLVHLILKPFFG